MTQAKIQKTACLFLFSVILTLSGCSHLLKKDDSVAIIETDHNAVTIGGIDGNRFWVRGIIWGSYPTMVSVPPGDHWLLICYMLSCGDKWLPIRTSAGKSYIVNHDLPEGFKGPMKLWVTEPDY